LKDSDHVEVAAGGQRSYECAGLPGRQLIGTRNEAEKGVETENHERQAEKDTNNVDDVLHMILKRGKSEN
jgi:hypothetical protein